MHVFIDESGNFIPLSGEKKKYSCVAALAVPTAIRDAVFTDYAKMRREIGGSNEELKGAQLTEGQAARIVSVLRRHDVLLQVGAVDMGNHNDDDVTRMREAQAQKVYDSVTPGYHQHDRGGAVAGKQDARLVEPAFRSVVPNTHSLREPAGERDDVLRAAAASGAGAFLLVGGRQSCRPHQFRGDLVQIDATASGTALQGTSDGNGSVG